MPAEQQGDRTEMTRLTLDQANAIIAGTIDTGRAAGSAPLTVVVIDDSGHLVAAQRQDGASMFRFDIAMGKAWGAVAFGVSSRDLAGKARDNPSFMQALAVTSGGRLLPNPGAVPILGADGAIVGAVGVSGDSGPEDEKFAIAGVEAAGLRTTTD
jgi:uncharacterized protein GlcG (DUF336 family)